MGPPQGERDVTSQGHAPGVRHCPSLAFAVAVRFLGRLLVNVDSGSGPSRPCLSLRNLLISHVCLRFDFLVCKTGVMSLALSMGITR